MEVAERFSVKPATIWNGLRNIPNFPKLVCISPGTTRWRAADIIQFEQEHLGG
jgi:predicted DNA-binding transcriptional regulator AlpA